jgi:endogenous inhibitor of DNA gyrase (YacG/DUF329 family)
MARDEITIGGCPACGSAALRCKYNHFASGELSIDSWEHRCPDCGQRQTRAFRSDDESSLSEGTDPAKCPFCGRASTSRPPDRT